MATPTEEYLRNLGCRECIHWSSVGRRPLITPWNPDEQWDGNETRGSYFLRYGVYNEGLKGSGFDPSQADLNPDLFTAGTMVGETGITLPEGCPPPRTAQDLQDLTVVKHPREARPVGYAWPTPEPTTPPSAPSPTTSPTPSQPSQPSTPPTPPTPTTPPITSPTTPKPSSPVLSPVPPEILQIAGDLRQLVARQQRPKVARLVDWVRSIESVKLKS